MGTIDRFPAVAEPASGWDQFKQAMRQSAERGWERGQRRAALRREARGLSLPAVEEMLRSIERDLLEALQARDARGDRETGKRSVGALMDDWQTVRAVLARRGGGR